MTREERFWAKVDRRGPDECWLWQAGTMRVRNFTYGSFWSGTYPRTGQLAHRYSLRIAGRDMPPGSHVHHICENTLCVNPNHLAVLTPAEHMRLGAKARQTHCIRGHEFTPENTRLKPTGQRVCIQCARARNQAYSGHGTASQHRRGYS